MSSSVLSRVITGQLELDPSKKIQIHSAELLGYKRFCVKGVDYPGLRPTPDIPDAKVLGKVAFNLTAEDVAKLDIFEGDEYSRQLAKVTDLQTGQEIRAHVYIWTAGEDLLLSQEWDFDSFERHKMHDWISEEMREIEGPDPRGNRFWNPQEVEMKVVKDS